MRHSAWTSSIVPNNDDRNVYIVLDDFGDNHRVFRETDVERADLEAVVMAMLEGEYRNPLRVVGFNTAEGWSQDVSADVAHEVRQRCDLQMRDVPFYLEDFVARYEGRFHDVQLPLPMRLVPPI
ncbi:MAG: hypothetical protein WBV83_04440 [Bradyrhizobium sp.]|jgi:hypothetical protein|uniref:hypothetical protein n=1 Tax=Bradyrhizobium sp. TaxID=376 RepID=UPI003BD5D4DD